MSSHALSFVIATSGERDGFLDAVVLPSALEQAERGDEVVLVGAYDGRRADDPRIRVVAAPIGTEMFYKPFQLGVEASTRRWIVDLDDDMILCPGWRTAVGRALEAQGSAQSLLGCSMVNADGSGYGGYFDAVDNALSGMLRGERTYFSCSIAGREIYCAAPYPTYLSGDRAHVLRIARAGLPVEKHLLASARVLHAGASMGHPGMTPKTNVERVERTRAVVARVLEAGVAWARFADRYLDGRPYIDSSTAMQFAAEAGADPAVRAREHWLW